MSVLPYYLKRYSAPGDLPQRRGSKVLFETVGEYRQRSSCDVCGRLDPNKEALVLKQLLE
jgi:hypothetical protein